MSDFNIYAGSAPTPSGCGSWLSFATSGDACSSLFCTTSPTNCLADCDKQLYVTTIRTPQTIEIGDIIYGSDNVILNEGWYVSNSTGLVFNINSSGVLTSVNACSGETVRDIDGNYYGTVVIGGQTWLKENLRTTRYKNGDVIPNITNATTWTNTNNGAYCAYNNDNNSACLGYLYNYHAVADARGLCPTGWSVPTKAQFDALGDELGGNNDAGGKMKIQGVVWWKTPNDGATDESGFNAFPAGRRRFGNGAFAYFGETATFWASNRVGCLTNFARLIQLKYDNNNMDVQCDDPDNGYSVRCIKD
jgi:uncharacterized protein (TIGR02145 family)